MRRPLQLGGFIAGLVLCLFGIAAIYMGVDGRSTVRKSLKSEAISGSPDMSRAGIAAEAKNAGLPASVDLPTCDVAGKPVVDGSSARCFASMMRIHALEATGGQTFAEMPRFASADGKGTNDPSKAAQRPGGGGPQDNPARSVWINETALATALNMGYMAEQLSVFGIVVGIALLLTGIGLIVLAWAALRRTSEEAAAGAIGRSGAPVGTPA